MEAKEELVIKCQLVTLVDFQIAVYEHNVSSLNLKIFL